jgi:hypothetical protein
MKALKGLQRYAEEIKKPFLVVDQQQKELASYIQKLEDEKTKLEQSTNVNDIDKLVEINSKLEAAYKMKDRLKEQYNDLRNSNGKEVYNHFTRLRAEYVNECKKEADPIYKQIYKRAQEIEELMNELHTFTNERSAELRKVITSFRPYVSEHVQRDFDSASYTGLQLHHLFQLYDSQFKSWKENIEKGR